MNAVFPEAFKLPIPERIQLLEDLWESIAKVPEQLPVHDWQVAELDARKERLKQDPKSGHTWEQVKASILNRDD